MNEPRSAYKVTMFDGSVSLECGADNNGDITNIDVVQAEDGRLYEPLPVKPRSLDRGYKGTPCSEGALLLDFSISLCIIKLMSVNRYDKSRSATFNIGYHLIWCTKYRRSVLSDAIQLRMKEVLTAKATELNLRIENMEIMPDHVHVFVKANPIDSPHHIIKHFKGITSFTLRKEFPELRRRLPCLWTRSYYVESVGHISQAVVKQYIEDQKSK